MSVQVTVCCSNCGQLDAISLGAWQASSNFFVGKCHNAIPDTHASIRNLLEERNSGYNVYEDTYCYELAEVQYKKSSKTCKGLIRVNFAGLSNS
eukprot:g11712.t1